ncbi:MAG TPA: Ppx/GppA phosphatase family protein [Candidatus Edwardsbacteria bacterium]|nr:Ppx/GppA phosphatase family protein [Candidatus Edwardsbacteria bacterium]
MPALAAIDVGSNALRLAVGTVDQQRRLTVIATAREALRLGQDVFNAGAIPEPTVEQLVAAFQRFRQIGQQHGASMTRAVGTSALREARNKEMVIDAVQQRTGIELAVIGPEEEARLVHLAVSQALDLRGVRALIIDIGGGSVEVTVAENGRIAGSECFMMGAVRLLQKLEQQKAGEQRFQRLVREYANTIDQRLKRMLGHGRIDLMAGVGGNIEALGDLRQQLLDKRGNDQLSADDLDLLLKKLAALEYPARVKQLGLRPDRADVIVPAAIVLRAVLLRAGTGKIAIPRVGLREGLLHDMVAELYQDAPVRHREQAVSAALQLGRKFAFDEQHATVVSRFALQLYDATRELHGLDGHHRLLLEVAALLHDVGQFVNINGHHKHSYYLIMASPIIGLTPQDRELVANVARYHRKAFPSIRHENFQRLEARDRVVATKLAAILRLADAFDTEHAAIISDVDIDSRRPKLKLTLRGEGDLLLVKWAIAKKSDLFEDVFGTGIALSD